MTIEEVVKQVLVDEHGDLVRAAPEAVCRELMEARCPSWSAPGAVSAARMIG